MNLKDEKNGLKDLKQGTTNKTGQGKVNMENFDDIVKKIRDKETKKTNTIVIHVVPPQSRVDHSSK